MCRVRLWMKGRGGWQTIRRRWKSVSKKKKKKKKKYWKMSSVCDGSPHWFHYTPGTLDINRYSCRTKWICIKIHRHVGGEKNIMQMSVYCRHIQIETHVTMRRGGNAHQEEVWASLCTRCQSHLWVFVPGLCQPFQETCKDNNRPITA